MYTTVLESLYITIYSSAACTDDPGSTHQSTGDPVHHDSLGEVHGIGHS